MLSGCCGNFVIITEFEEDGDCCGLTKSKIVKCLEDLRGLGSASINPAKIQNVSSLKIELSVLDGRFQAWHAFYWHTSHTGTSWKM